MDLTKRFNVYESVGGSASNPTVIIVLVFFRYRSQWMSSLRLAISRFHCKESYGRYLRNKRRLEWHRIRIRRQMEDNRIREMLMTEKLVRLCTKFVSIVRSVKGPPREQNLMLMRYK